MLPLIVIGSILTNREFWVAFHGSVWGGVLVGILVFAGLAGFWHFRPQLTPERARKRVTRIRVSVWLAAVAVWVACFSGAYIVYPWYRAKPPQGTTDLTGFPRSYLLADPSRAGLHNFGMEWKEHVAFLALIMLTGLAWIVHRYAPQLGRNSRLRYSVTALYALVLVVVVTTFVLGSLIAQAAPVR